MGEYGDRAQIIDRHNRLGQQRVALDRFLRVQQSETEEDIESPLRQGFDEGRVARPIRGVEPAHLDHAAAADADVGGAALHVLQVATG